MPEEQVGRVTHYFGKVGVAGIDVTAGEIKVGDTIHITGHTTDFNQTIDSMQIDNQDVEQATKDDSIGIKVSDRVRPHDIVYRVLPD
jgi:translation initiation factor IF-2